MGIGHEEWAGLPWHIRRAYLEGMGADESVPLSFERREETYGQEAAQVAEAGAPQGMPWAERNAPPAEVIDISGMISGLEASRSGGR